MSSRVYIIIGMLVTILLFTSCGRQYHAEQKVEEFVEANAEAPGKMVKRDFADMGETRHINDSLVQVMRQRGAEGFKKGIVYGKVPTGNLYYLRMRYIVDNDTLQNTFYLNEELTEVVAFK